MSPRNKGLVCVGGTRCRDLRHEVHAELHEAADYPPDPLRKAAHTQLEIMTSARILSNQAHMLSTLK